MDNPKFQSSLRPFNVAAASLLPPASPAAIGISFSIVMDTPCLMPYVSLMRRAA